MILKKLKWIFTHQCDCEGTKRRIPGSFKKGIYFHECLVCNALFENGKKQEE